MVSDFQWGTASAQPVTLSFWAFSSLTGTFGGSIRNYAGTPLLSVHLSHSDREHLDEDRCHHPRRHGWNVGDERQCRSAVGQLRSWQRRDLSRPRQRMGDRRVISARPARSASSPTNGASFLCDRRQAGDRQRRNAVQSAVARQEHGRLPAVLSDR